MNTEKMMLKPLAVLGLAVVATPGHSRPLK
jgi:hypothetical protein